MRVILSNRHRHGHTCMSTSGVEGSQETRRRLGCADGIDRAMLSNAPGLSTVHGREKQGGTHLGWYNNRTVKLTSVSPQIYTSQRPLLFDACLCATLSRRK